MSLVLSCFMYACRGIARLSTFTFVGKKRHFFIFSSFFYIFSDFSSICLHFFPEFGPPGGWLALPWIWFKKKKKKKTAGKVWPLACCPHLTYTYGSGFEWCRKKEGKQADHFFLFFAHKHVLIWRCHICLKPAFHIQ